MLEVMGWATPISRLRDEGRTSHLMVVRDGTYVPYCGVSCYTFGQITRHPQCHRCRRCCQINYANPGKPKTRKQRAQEKLIKDFGAHLDREIWKNYRR